MKNNRVEVEIISGALTSLEAAATPVTVAKLYTSGLGTGGSMFGPVNDTEDHSSPLRWLDDQHVAFLCTDERGVRQLVQVNLVTRTVKYLTRHPTHVVTYDMNRDGTIVYSAKAPAAKHDTAATMRSGYAVDEHSDPSSLFRRDLSGTNLYDNAWSTQWFVLDRGARTARPLQLAGRLVQIDYRHRASFSPDGRTVLINAMPDGIPAEWTQYTARDMKAWITLAQQDQRSPMARGVQQLFLVDVKQGTSRPLWNAPGLIYITKVAWSGDGQRVLLAPAYLPPDGADERGLAGEAGAIVDVATGKYEQLPVRLVGLTSVIAVRWIDADHVEIDERKGLDLVRHRFARSDGSWTAAGNAEKVAEERAGIRMQLRQSLESAPKLFAVDAATGEARQVRDLNPTLDTSRLGRAEKVEGTLADGSAWIGLLLYPPGYEAGRRYPLVIQSVYGLRVDDEFTLYGLQQGLGLGPPPVASYPGRVLAGRGILVLQMDVRMGRKYGTPEEAPMRREGFERAAEHLIAKGLAEPAKVGLAGFSRNGFYVEYTLTHSDFPFAAALSADNWDPSYFQQTLTGDLGSASAVYGKEPFGDGLAGWLEGAPGFNAHRITTPLLMVEQSMGIYGVLAKWETFSRLRYLRRPVEFYVMPDAEAHGAHNTQSPGQVIPVMQRSVDWFDFWLNGREDAGESKRAQYAAWRELRQLQQAAAERPRPPLLQWSASPKTGAR